MERLSVAASHARGFGNDIKVYIYKYSIQPCPQAHAVEKLPIMEHHLQMQLLMLN